VREIVAAVPSEYKGLGVRKYFTTIGNLYNR
jgi:hypothetical protein